MDYDDKLIDDIAKAYWSQEETDDFPLTIAAIKRAFAQVRESERERLADDWPDWSNFRVMHKSGIIEYHELEPRIELQGHGADWVSDGRQQYAEGPVPHWRHSLQCRPKRKK